MDYARQRAAIGGLQAFVKELAKAGVHDAASWREWRRLPRNIRQMEQWFGYDQRGGMPCVSSLVKPYFHRKLPLIGLNYTNVAHNVLHLTPDGWTPEVRMCRGIIFDRVGRLVALPFPKFFNSGEHPETSVDDGEELEATDKLDGHMGTIFRYDGKVLLATRHTFDGPTAQLGNRMLLRKRRLLAKAPDWDALTLITEVIDRATKVHLDYGRKSNLVLIGARRLSDCVDLRHDELVRLGRQLGLPVTERFTGLTRADLRALMEDRSVTDREGVVAFYPATGKREKHKFATYIGKMVAAKLSYGYLMNRMMTGTLDLMVGTLDFEGQQEAKSMVAAIRKAALRKGASQKEKWAALYALDEEKKDNAYYRGICRKYLKSLSA